MSTLKHTSILYISGPQPPVRGPVPVRESVGAGPHKELLISVGIPFVP